jgi:hypothetical protein
MDRYIEDLCHVIRSGDMQNTYKTAWIRAIVEICSLEEGAGTIHFDQISRKMFGYYWNQTIFFGLEQSPNPNKRPKIYQIVVDAINTYQREFGAKPEWFTRIEHQLSIPVSRISPVLCSDVSWRFPKVGSDEYQIYDLDLQNRQLVIHQPELIRQHSDVLFDLINYRWTQKLEEFNHSPRISKKVRGTDRESMTRGSLAKFKKYLDMENPNHICFFTGKEIPDGSLSIDHVLPWSYLFSDDLWNLVYVDRSVNSAKGNKIPTKSEIASLKARNLRLLQSLSDAGKKDKQTEELKLAIENDLVSKFWIGCKG